MKVLGLDPGVAILGWSLIETHPSGRHEVQMGAIQTPAHLSLNLRLVMLFDQLKEIFELHRPSALAIETLFLVKSAKTLAMVAHARGIALLLAGQYKTEIFEYAPRQVKLALTGYGAADKKQMQNVLQRMLGLSSLPKPDDAADAAAVALCHMQYAQALGKSMVTV